VIETIRQGLQAEGITVSIAKLCRWFNVPRRTVYYRPVKAAPKVDKRFSEPIKAMIEESPSFGYRTVAHLLGFNKNTVQRVFQLMGWQVKKRAIGFRPRIQAMPSVATAPNERWSTDLCRIWAGRDGWATLALVIDCHTRELLGWHLSRRRQGLHGEQCLGACIDRPVRHAGARPGALLASIRQWARFYQPKLYRPGSWVRTAPGVHHATLPAAKRHGRTGDPHAQRAMCASASLRNPAACQPRDRRLDTLL